jgi:hypothetical protein
MLGATATAWGGVLEVAALLLLFAVGFNLVPLGLRREGRWLDGDWLLAWLLRPHLATQRVAVGALHQAIEAGQRPREWDERWARLAFLDHRHRASSLEVMGDILGYMSALDRGQIDEAGRLLAQAFAGRRLLPADQCAAVTVEAAFFVARYRGRCALATRLLDAVPRQSSELLTAGLEMAQAAVHLAAGERAEAATACDRALAALDALRDVPPGLIAFDRDQVSAIRDAPLTVPSEARSVRGQR